MSEWRCRAWSIITEVDATLSPEATIPERRAALSEAAWYAHAGTSWGKKVWGKAVREYLSRHGVRRYRAPRATPGQPDLFLTGSGA